MNKGERAELLFIATLGCYRGSSLPIHGFNGGVIQSIKTPSNKSLIEVLDYSDSTTPLAISRFSEAELIHFCKVNNIHKAGPLSKADIYINNVGYSLKYTGSAPPAIVNHTARPGWETAAKAKNVDINALDNLIDAYWTKRISGLIKEDVSNADENSPFKFNVEILSPYLEYFSFDGTGSGSSIHPASQVIEFNKPFDTTSWKCVSRTDFINDVWSKLVFSVRSKKGMPSDIDSPRLSADKRASILRWSKNHQGELRGALHVRVRKK
jgi:hypothetical protein